MRTNVGVCGTPRRLHGFTICGLDALDFPIHLQFRWRCSMPQAASSMRAASDCNPTCTRCRGRRTNACWGHWHTPTSRMLNEGWASCTAGRHPREPWMRQYSVQPRCARDRKASQPSEALPTPARMNHARGRPWNLVAHSTEARVLNMPPDAEVVRGKRHIFLLHFVMRENVTLRNYVIILDFCREIPVPLLEA